MPLATAYWSHLVRVYIYMQCSLFCRVSISWTEVKRKGRIVWIGALGVCILHVRIYPRRTRIRVCCLATAGLRRARRGHPSSFVTLSVCACNNELARERFHYIRGCVEAVWFNLFLACTCVVWVGSQNCCNRPYQFTYCCWLMFINLFVVFWFKNKLNIR